MTESNLTSKPNTLFVSLKHPAKLYLTPSRWNPDAQVKIQGIAVRGNDTPWVSTVCDVLIDQESRSFVGLTFEIQDKESWRPMRQLAKQLDPRVVRYNDISTTSAKNMYPGESGRVHRFEITWTTANI